MNSDEIKTKVLNGTHPQPEKIDSTPIEYQEIMEKGWNLDPSQRPTIEEIFNVLNKLDSEFLNGRIENDNSNDNKYLSPNAAIKDDEPFEDKDSSIVTDYSNTNNVMTHFVKRKGLDKFNPFHKNLDFEEAIKLHNQRRYKKAWKIFKEIEEKTGTPEAKFCVGYYYLKGYYKGRGGNPDPDASLKYLYQAAKSGHRNAQYWYAEVILNHKLETQQNDRDHKLAIEFLHEAAKQGCISALRDLGEIINKGKYGYTPDNTVGKAMIRKAHTMSLLYSLDGLN